jgi:hypothetical protein
MPSTYDPLLRLELQATGENATTWGIKTNTNLDLLAESIAGAVNLNVAGSGDFTLSTASGAEDEARYAILVLTGTLTGDRNIIVPSSPKNYTVINQTTGAFTVTLKQSAGTGFALPPSGPSLAVVTSTTCVQVAGGTFTAPILIETSTTATALRITQTGTGNALVVEDSANPDASPFIITAAGDVGIGTSAPAGKLQVAGGRALFGPNSEVYAIGVGFNPTRVASGEVFYVGASDSVTPDLVIANASGLERARITSAGDVGIGTAAPTAKLDVSGNAVISGTATVGAGTAAAPAITFSGDANTGIYSPAADTIAFSEGGVESMRIDSDGKLLLATTSLGPFFDGILNVQGRTHLRDDAPSDPVLYTWNQATSGTRRFIEFGLGTTYTGVGAITSNGTTTTYATTSDYRLKENVQPMQGALAKIAQLNPVTYTWKIDGSDGQGFIAHELQAVAPDCVTGEKDAVDANGNPQYQGIDTSFLVATLVKAIQELKAEVDSLHTQLENR